MTGHHVPIAVIGGGRWGRTWIRVITNARGTSRGLIIVARTNAPDVRRWLDQQADLRDTIVLSRISDIETASSKPVVAIIASRPRDHVRDGLEALDAGLHLLVEKPVSHDAVQAKQLYTAVQRTSRLMAIGTEFAFLPVFHVAAALYSNRSEHPLNVALEWDDANGEQRHGSLKRHHEETSVLVDLLSHAISIFRMFSSASKFHIERADISPDENRGHLAIINDDGARFSLRCNRTAAARRRMLEIDGAATNITIDFAENASSLILDGETHQISDDLVALFSTLRLELGAFLSEIAEEAHPTQILSGIDELLSLQLDLERKLVIKS